MSMITRVRDIVNSNINSVLDKAENPEKLLKQMIRVMEDTLIEVKGACAQAMTGRKKAERDQASAQSMVNHWSERAELAVQRGRDNLAREALMAKQRFQTDVENIQQALDQLAGLVEQYKNDIVLLENKLQSARTKNRVVQQRYTHAVKSRQSQRVIRALDNTQVIMRYEAFEERLDRAESEQALTNFGRPSPSSLEDAFMDMERDVSIDEELRALKKKVGSTQTDVVLA